MNSGGILPIQQINQFLMRLSLLHLQMTLPFFGTWKSITAYENLQNRLNYLQSWLSKWRIRENGDKFAHITFITKRSTYSQITINNTSRPTKTHTKAKKIQLISQTNELDSGMKFQISIKNQLLWYRTIQSIWVYWIE